MGEAADGAHGAQCRFRFRPGADARQVHAERGLAVGLRGRQSHAESLARKLHGIGEPSLLETDSKKHNRRLGTIIASERVPGMECCQPQAAVKQVLLSGSMTHGSASILTNHCSGSVHRAAVAAAEEIADAPESPNFASLHRYGLENGGVRMTDFRSTVHVPVTQFPMRGDLLKRQKEILARWQAQDLYRAFWKTAATRGPLRKNDVSD